MLSSAAIFFVNAGVIDDVVEIFIDHSNGPLDPDLIGQRLWAMNAEAMRHEHLPIGVSDSLRYAHHINEAQAYRFHRGSGLQSQRAKSCACFLQQCERPVNADHELLCQLKCIVKDASDLDTWSVDEVWNREREKTRISLSGSFERILL